MRRPSPQGPFPIQLRDASSGSPRTIRGHEARPVLVDRPGQARRLARELDLLQAACRLLLARGPSGCSPMLIGAALSRDLFPEPIHMA